MPKTSAGLLMYKIKDGKLMVFLVHPGGPFWENKDNGVWGIPKGEQDDTSHELLDVAKREFSEETGIAVPEDINFIELGNIKQKNGKIVYAWAFRNENNFEFKCESFVEIEKASLLSSDNENYRFPEVDKGEFFSVKEAKEKILSSQFELIERLMKELNINKSNKFNKQLNLGDF